jgi:hypothetical protein
MVSAPEFGFDSAVESAEREHTVLMQHCPNGGSESTARSSARSPRPHPGALAELGSRGADDCSPSRPGVCAAHLEETTV